MPETDGLPLADPSASERNDYPSNGALRGGPPVTRASLLLLAESGRIETRFPTYRFHTDMDHVIVCGHCGTPFTRSTKLVNMALKLGCNESYCSPTCFGMHCTKPKFTVPCGHCGLPVTRAERWLRKSKSGHLFCNHTCAATYANTHKTKGTRRSKLEVWLEARLRELYPSLTLLPNDKAAINSELDFYFPDLRLAFELNGPLHYEPIYGPEKLASIQNNDTRKFQACLEKGIELCIIDSSQFKNFKEAGASRFLNLILGVVEPKLLGSVSDRPDWKG